MDPAYVESAARYSTPSLKAGARTAAVDGVQQLPALDLREAQPVAAGADDGGVGGRGFCCCR